MAGWALNSALLSFVTMKERVWLDSLAGPTLSPVAQFGTDWTPTFSLTVWFAPPVNDGTWFTGVTVIVTLPVSTPPWPSLML
jgi:hypothetical protein